VIRVKVCGITRPTDAALAVELGAGLLGLNFWPGSPRAISPAAGRAIADAVRGRATLVGVFVDQPAAEIARVVDTVGLDLVQLHGDETPAAAAPLLARAIKALRVLDGADPAAAAAPWGGCWGLLFDAPRAGAYGGTGHAWRWERAAAALPGRRVLLAGGVAPGRVRDLVARCRAAAGEAPWGVDVCSGVESSPGRKDPALLRALLEEVRDVETATVA
jgi:phosphoribosylanthranilate isomerase